MGSGGSRGKKVAPASVTEVNVYETEKDSDQKDGGLFQPFKIQKLADFNRSWSGARPDCHSEGNDSEFSADDDDIEVELDRVMTEYENRRFNSKKGSRKKSFERSKTYGFCNTSRAYSGGDFTSTRFHSSEPPGRTRQPSNTGSVRASDKELTTFTQPWKNTQYDLNSHSRTFQATTGFQDPPTLRKSEDQGLAEETALIPGCCDAPDGLTLPVILYNGSEEDLMETIEREFS